jgi:phage-related protein
MAEDREWEIIYYTDEHNVSPVEEFLQGLDLKTQARFDWSIERLRQLNVHAREPLVKHIEGKIWELRRSSDGNIFRLLYFFYTGRQIVFLHGFAKKTQKTPRREIDTAQRRLDDFIKRAEGGENS